jgi:hypothetical protein
MPGREVAGEVFSTLGIAFNFVTFSAQIPMVR